MNAGLAEEIVNSSYNHCPQMTPKPKQHRSSMKSRNCTSFKNSRKKSLKFGKNVPIFCPRRFHRPNLMIKSLHNIYFLMITVEPTRQWTLKSSDGFFRSSDFLKIKRKFPLQKLVSL